MALVVEDGTGKPDAESYISVVDALAYLTSRGDVVFSAAAQAAQEAALRNATDYMVSVYRYRWAGYRYTLGQALDWPRETVPVLDYAFGYGPYPTYYPYDAVPVPVQQACADLAVRALSGPLMPDIQRIKKSVKIGPLAVEYDTAQPATTTLVAVGTKLAPYLTGQGMRTTLVRS